MPISNEDIQELQKLQKMVTQLENILKISNNEEQKQRVSKDLIKYRKRILEISPEGVPENLYSAPNKSEKHSEKEEKQQVNDTNVDTINNDILSNITILKMCPHSNDNEINLLATIINIMENDYLPILGESHIKLDFSHATERDNIFKYMENIRRNMKVLTETIEEFALADKQDFKEQLGRMKNKQSRIFISEAGDLFKNYKDFLQKLVIDAEAGGTVVTNLDEKIHFNPKFERSTMFEGVEVKKAIKQFYEFTKAALSNVNLPSMKR